VSVEAKKILRYPVGKKIIFVLLVLFFAAFVSGNRGKFLIEIPFRVLCGWAIHASKALPHLFGKWQEAVLPVGCLFMAAVIAHRFVGRWVDEKFPARTWRIRHTAAALALLLLGSAAAIAASGVVHQMFWLAKGKVTERSGKGDVTVAINNGRQLMFGLLEYENEKGRYPHTFEELEMELEAGYYPGMFRRLWWLWSLDTRDGKVPEPWILLRPGSSEVALNDEPVIVSPVIVREGMVVLGYGDCSVRSIRAEKLNEVLAQGKAAESEVGR
jgi:hypothetical protein